MRLFKGFAIAGVSSLVVAMSYGCSSTTTIVDNGDAGGGTDSGGVVKKDAATDSAVVDSGNTGGACGPVDTTSYTPRAYSPPSGKHQKKCTAMQIQDYVSCITGADKTKCTQFQMGGAGVSCSACVETNATDAAWGPLVSPDGKTLSFNVPGCLDLANTGTMCGKSLDASYGCQDFSCGACDSTTTPNFSTCVNSSLKKQCKTYGDAVTTSCATQFGDAGSPDVATYCQPDQTIADPKAQQTAFLVSISTYFCGP